MLDPDLVEEVSHEARVMFDPIIVVGERPGQAEARQIEANDARFLLQGSNPPSPGVKATRSAVDQNDQMRSPRGPPSHRCLLEIVGATRADGTKGTDA